MSMVTATAAAMRTRGSKYAGVGDRQLQETVMLQGTETAIPAALAMGTRSTCRRLGCCWALA